MIRAFLAVVPDAELLRRLALVQQDLKQRLMRDLPRTVRLSWVQPASIHLTLKFLGDIPEDLVPVLNDAMIQTMSGHRSLSIPLERLGAFPDARRPRILWAGPGTSWEESEDSRRLAAMHEAIEMCCRTVDLAPDSRALTPHLTLARVREGDRYLGSQLTRNGELNNPIRPGAFEVGAVVLMRSELHPTGSVYTPLWDVRLA
ncbi:putative 2'-5' RNA ligase [Nitrospira japonica]|uniref:RNA 2',3'-cyclic phosphodiesterase n=1 Tax=Nitrospira japonica TaxID=1325564 RepID=A0A1W1I7Z1_9BACT|nr:RNA 2',3'-cyclic phosphodiesterase [Nitrospira japonica]SLM49120.1 putative 2'-5' RNA ligase [Nitrospira japonica]